MLEFCQDCFANMHTLLTQKRETGEGWSRGSSFSVYPAMRYVLRSLTYFMTCTDDFIPLTFLHGAYSKKKGLLWGSPSKTLLRTLRLSKIKLDCQSRERLGNAMDGVGVRRKEMVGRGDSHSTIRANWSALLFYHPLPHPFPHPPPLQKNCPRYRLFAYFLQ